MNKVVQKVNGKVNLTLDIVGAENGFHNLESLVASIGLTDKITLIKRTDKVITLEERGILSGCQPTDNNAYRTAKEFMELYNTTGVDIILEKRIPVGAGLGGSSADIAGVLMGMKKLYKIKADLTLLANKLGSDACFMLDGGVAVMLGKGDIVKKIFYNKKLYLVLLTNAKTISAKACYKAYDEIGKKYKPCTQKAVEYLVEGEFNKFCKIIKNDLTQSANAFIPELENCLNIIKKSGASASILTGSGSVVYGIYESKAKQKIGYENLKATFTEGRLIKTTTLPTKLKTK